MILYSKSKKDQIQSKYCIFHCCGTTVFALPKNSIRVGGSNYDTPPHSLEMDNIRLWHRYQSKEHVKHFQLVLHLPKSHKYSKRYDQLKIEWGKIHVLHLLNHKSCLVAPPSPITTTHLPQPTKTPPKFCIILCLHYLFLCTLPCHLSWLRHLSIFYQMIQTTHLLCHPEKMMNPLTPRLSHTVRLLSSDSSNNPPKKKTQSKPYKIQLAREMVDC